MLRPHPQTVKFSKNTLDSICRKHTTNTNFEYEVRIQNKKRLIKLLDTAYVGTFVEEFRSLIR